VTDPVLVRDATDADVAQIAAIYGREVLHGIATFEEAPPSEHEMAGRMSKIQALGLPYLVAERAGTVLGYAYAGQFHARAAYRYTLEDTVYIHQDARRQGVGKALLEAILDRSEALGARQMIALISYAPNSGSVALHTQLGFRPIGILKSVGYKFGRWLDVAYMQRQIGASDTNAPDRPVLGPHPIGKN
jgi:phosphinothricin acetyltransferase